MRFNYEYRTSANELKNGSICASTRERVFVELRTRGIRPCRVVEAPGFFNKLFGKGKRWLAIGVLAGALLLVLLLVYRNVGLVVLVKHNSPSEREMLKLPVALSADPDIKAELQRYVEERQSAEREYRDRFIKRVNSGTISKDEANRIFRAMGFEELP